MPIPTRELTAALEDKFKFVPRQSGDERFCFYLDGELAAHTKVSRSWDDVSDQMLGVIARQVGVSGKELREMVACTLGADAYEQKLRSSDAAPAATVRSTPRKSTGARKPAKAQHRSGKRRKRPGR